MVKKETRSQELPHWSQKVSNQIPLPAIKNTPFNRCALILLDFLSIIDLRYPIAVRPNICV